MIFKIIKKRFIKHIDYVALFIENESHLKEINKLKLNEIKLINMKNRYVAEKRILSNENKVLKKENIKLKDENNKLKDENVFFKGEN